MHADRRTYIGKISGSGKTQLLKDLLLRFRSIYGETFGKLILVYHIDQPVYSEIIEQLPSNVKVVRFRGGIRNELFEPETLKCSDGRISVLVLDEPGAERLLGRGHLAAKLSGEGEIILAQVPFADEDEMAELADLIRSAWSQD